MIKIISGFQSGVDQGSMRAAKELKFPTGGFIPRGFLTEDGPRPEFAELYGAAETPSTNYVQRTSWNVRDSDATLWFGDSKSRGGIATWKACDQFNKPFCIIYSDWTPESTANYIDTICDFKDDKLCINIAGNRESVAPGIGESAEQYFRKVFLILREKYNV